MCLGVPYLKVISKLLLIAAIYLAGLLTLASLHYPGALFVIYPELSLHKVLAK